MNLNQVKTYVSGVLKGWILNKGTLDKLSESENGNLLFDGNEIKGGFSSVEKAYINIDNYSEKEIIIGKWTNSKPICRKTFI